MKELIKIQQELKAPKGQYNSFGHYEYRSCEDILKALKPLLSENGCFLILSDDVISIGNRFYIQATATITNSEGVQVAVRALAREEDQKKGMDGSQITGTASSYARKYALSGLFCIDDTKDADTDEHKKQQESDTAPFDDTLAKAIDEVNHATSRAEVKRINEKWTAYKENPDFRKACNDKHSSLPKE